jgi:hypothetical protein
MINQHSFSRRDLLQRSAALVPICTLVSFSSAALAENAACVDLNTLSGEDKYRRTSKHYAEKSAISSEVCASCVLFHDAGNGCGTCKIFNDGPTNPKGHCDSWTAKS